MVRCAGFATVTFGGGGAACCCCPSLQPASAPANAIRATALRARRDKLGWDKPVITRFGPMETRIGIGMRSIGKVMQDAGKIWAVPPRNRQGPGVACL